MAAAKGKTPIIIKRVTVTQGGHHGGAWKVAYADFVTAMMAFFLLMWLLNATTEKQRKGLAEYFSPTILQSSGSGAAALDGGEAPQTERISASDPGAGKDGFEDLARQVQNELTGTGAEAMQRVNLLRHVVTRMTDEGLVIELGDIAGEPLFDGDTAAPAPVLAELTRLLAQVLGRVRNDIAVSGHVRGFPEMMVDSPVWPLSAGRAATVRDLVVTGGLDARRIQRVTAHADRRLRNANPMDPANNRIEVILLR